MADELTNAAVALHNEQTIATRLPSQKRAALLLLIVAVGFLLRVRGLERVGFNEDEINKVQAARA